ncbi:MAG: alpha/beta hydrolase [Nitrosomonas sp.]|nr:alpha/beta hydrolase [Nitrosomonas sp.]
MAQLSRLLDTIEVTTDANPSHTVIWMHGLGADGNDFVPVIQMLDLPAASVRFIFPHAPLRSVSVNGGLRMRAWYDIKHANLSKDEDEDGLQASEQAIAALIRQENQRGIASDQIILAGFSQGGAMALQTGLRYPEMLAGVMVLSAYLPLANIAMQQAHPANRKTPVFMAHGEDDPIVPIHLAIASRQCLRAEHYTVEWHQYPMAHSVCDQELTDISRWLTKILTTIRFK